MSHRRLAILAILFLATLSGQRSLTQWRTLDGKPPLVIGHRGAAGHRPDHTLEGYRLAIEMGADFVEPDIVSTRDGVLIARHEPLLDDTTNIATIPEFASRKTTRTLDGVKIAGFWASDFTLEEIKRMRAVQPLAFRSKAYDGFYQIPTLEEIIELVQGENSHRSRVIGIYPETKHPVFHASLGLQTEDTLLKVLDKYGWNRKDAPVIIQSFESGSLKYLRPRTQLRLVQLIDADDVGPDGKLKYAPPYDKPYNHAVNGDPRGFADMVTPANLADIAKYANGIGPWKPYMISAAGTGPVFTTSLIEDAHKAGLFVHAYTFRSEPQYLLPAYNGNPRNEYMQFFALGVDGVFSDYPDAAYAARDAYR
jgi:glycerophosphoryl diester phosphodiesterase